MKILSRINSLEKRIKKRNKKRIVISVPYFNAKREKQDYSQLAKEYISKENLQADSFVFLINYAKTEVKKISESWYK